MGGRIRSIAVSVPCIIALAVFLRSHGLEQAVANREEGTGSPLVRLHFGAPAELVRTASAYIETHGIPAFLDEYYNLVGTKEPASFTAENNALARALGLHVDRDALPVMVEKRDVHATLPESKVLADRRLLADYFADEINLPQLGRAQRGFLEASFSAPRNYTSVLRRPGGDVVVGWNTWAEVPDLDKAALYTFGVVGCTVVFAVAPDGAAHLSHYDFIVNRTQIYVLRDFLDRHPDAQVHIIGVKADELARYLYAGDKSLPIFVGVKELYEEVAFALRFTREHGKLRTFYFERWISGDFLRSLQYTRYSLWFAYGRISQMFPGHDDAFQSLAFKRFVGSPAPDDDAMIYSRAGGTLHPGQFTSVEQYWLDRGVTTPR